MTHITYALTESYAMSAMTVGTIFLVSRIFDGITDVLAGYVIDRTNTKWGKARPYELFMIAAWVFVVLSFSVPMGLSNVGKIVFVFLTYNLYSSVFYTLGSCAEPIRLKRCFDEEGRVTASTINGIFTPLAAIVAIAVPVMISIFAKRPHGWTIIALIIAVPCCILTLIRFFFLPETVIETEEEQKAPKIGMIESVKLLFSNRYGLIYLLVTLVTVIVSNTNVNNYYFQYVFGDVALASVAGMLSLLGLLAVLLLPVMTKKLGKKNSLILCFAITAVGYAARYFFPTNIIWYSAMTIVTLIGTIPFNFMRPLVLIDCMDYGKWKTGRNAEGIYAAAFSVMNKAGFGLASFLLGIFLHLGGMTDHWKRRVSPL
jgi:GPH family glycoside/pentoside/hexuronide:cation symporter